MKISGCYSDSEKSYVKFGLVKDYTKKISNKKFSAFTLAEMMVVMLIMSIILAAMAPVMTTRSKADSSSPWRYSPDNASDAYFGIGNSQIAMIGQPNKLDTDDAARLIINSTDAVRTQISFKRNNANAGRLYMDTNHNIIYGNSTMDKLAGGSHNIAIGLNNLTEITSGQSNIAIGDSALVSNTSGRRNTAIGTCLGSNTTGSDNTAIGDDNLASNTTGINNVALGVDALAKATTANWNVAIGKNAYQNGLGSTNTIIGGDAMSKGSGSNNVALGTNALYYGDGDGNVAIGANADYTTNVLSSYKNSTAVGFSAQGPGEASTAIGYNSKAGSNGSVALGDSAASSDIQAIAIGASTVASGDSSIAIGSKGTVGVTTIGTSASASQTIAIGDMTRATATSAIAIGTSSTVGGNYATGLGYNAVASANNSLALGASSTANKVNSVSLGVSSGATGDYSSALGPSSTASGNRAIAVGNGATSSNDTTVSIGDSSSASAEDAIAIGDRTQASGNSSVAIGSSSSSGVTRATANYSIAIGDGTYASGASSVSIGDIASATGSKSVSLGYSAISNGTDSIAIGRSAKAKNSNNIAIGTNACQYVTGGNKICIGANSGPKSGDSWGTDSEERIFIGSQSKFNSGNAVLEVHNKSGYEGRIYDNKYLPGSVVVVNGALLVKGGIITSMPWADGGHFNGDGGLNMIGRTRGQLEAINTESGTGEVDFQEIFVSNNRGQFRSPNNYTNGSVYSGWSDKRLKYVGKEFKSGLDKIRELKVYNYTFKKDKNKTPHVGVIAQDLQKVFPNAVKKASNGFLTIRMEDMFYAMINAIKELDLKYQAQEKRINDLEKRIEILEAKIK